MHGSSGISEPSAIRPPPQIDVNATNLAYEFRKWKELVQLYLEAGEHTRKPKATQRALIQYCAGPSIVEVSSQFVYGDDEDRNDLAVLLGKIETFCNPNKNETLERYRFWNATYERTFEKYLIHANLQR